LRKRWCRKIGARKKKVLTVAMTRFTGENREQIRFLIGWARLFTPEFTLLVRHAVAALNVPTASKSVSWLDFLPLLTV
jgi:hypothetical protein